MISRIPYILAVFGAFPLCAATLSYSTAPPQPAVSDVSSFPAAGMDRNNISGNGTTDGAGNDAATYVAQDRPHQGQTFTTGPHADGYQLKAVWLRHSAYSGNTASTYWRTPNGSSLTVRVTRPASAGSADFALDTETVATTGTEAGTPNDFAPRASVTNSATGTGVWVRFASDSPVTIGPNGVFGFDVTSSSANLFFETHGIRDAAAGGNPYAGGSAYSGGTNGVPDSTLNALSGDRAFMVELEPAGPPVVTISGAEPFPIERVRLLESRFKQNQDLHRTGYLAWLSPDRLLYQFRVIANLPQPPGVMHLGGWEGSGGFTAVRGHMAGHYLTAAAKMYAATGDASYLPKINYLVAELKKCQDAIGAQEIAAGRVHGYLSGFPVSFFSTLETNPGAAQVPFYTIHKILAGLVDAYIHCGNQTAIEMAIAMSDYHRWRIDRLTQAQIEAMFRTDNGNTEEWGGMNETLSEIHRLSLARGDANPQRHLDFAKIFHRDWFINPLVAGTHQLNGLHANTHVPQVVGFARVASMLDSSDPQHDRLYTAAENFWKMVINDHWLVLGGNSYAEFFNQPGKETGPNGSALTVSTAETCNTHNMMKLTKELFQHSPSAAHADYYEHALYNHILASLAPDTGMPTYFVPAVSGHFKTYSQPEGSCWCCTGTGIKNTARYNEAIYFHKDSDLWVNLFVPSILDWSEKGITVRLDTTFPAGENVTLTLTCPQPTEATLRIRIPSWIAAPPVVKINGAIQPVTPAPGSFLEIPRNWQSGDTVEFTLPMSLRLDRSGDDPTQVSLFHGPILLAGDLGAANLPASDQAPDQWDYQGWPRVAAPALVGGASPLAEPTATPLVYTAAAAPTDGKPRTPVTLKPFYDIHHTRYAMYWKLFEPAGTAIWSGGSGNWATAGNWNTAPAPGWALDFAAASGGGAVNDLTAGTPVRGISFSSAAGPFVLSGSAIDLGGDVSNTSSHPQRIDLPLHLIDGIAWRFDASTADIVLAGPLSGNGSLEKRGGETLTLLGETALAGTISVAAGTLEVGNGGSLGTTTVHLESGSHLVLNKSDTFTVAAPIGGSGTLIKRGPGTLLLAAPVSGRTKVEDGTLRLSSRQIPVLGNRWSFNGNLADSAGSSPATVVEVGSNNTTLSSTGITLSGGAKGASDYVSLGSGLLPKDGRQLTIEFWATRRGHQNWSRIFDAGVSTAENLFMTWGRETVNTDRVEWKDLATSTDDDTVAPYQADTEYHILMSIEPGAGTGGTTRVSWFAAPASSGGLGTAKGSFDTSNTLAALNDSAFWLGRSQYNDPTASASYNEVRLWNRAFSAGEREQLHALGPDSTGAFASQTVFGNLDSGASLELTGSGKLELDGRSQTLASLAGSPESSVSLGGGTLTIAAGQTDTDVFAGTFSGPGTLRNEGVLRLVGDAALPPGIVFENHGLLDIMTWRGTLPAGFVNHGTVLDRSKVTVNVIALEAPDFTLTIHGYRGHTYQLQFRDDLAAGEWSALGEPVPGADAPLTFSHSGGAAPPRRFYRVVVQP